MSARFNGQFSILSRSAVQFWRASLSTPRGSLSSLIFAGVGISRLRRLIAEADNSDARQASGSPRLGTPTLHPSDASLRKQEAAT